MPSPLSALRSYLLPNDDVDLDLVPELGALPPAQRRPTLLRAEILASRSSYAFPLVILFTFTLVALPIFILVGLTGLFSAALGVPVALVITIPSFAATLLTHHAFFRRLSACLARPHLPRVLPGHCTHCGYDLRATPNHCPECGVTCRVSPP